MSEITELPPFNWLPEAKIFNKNSNQVPSEWIIDNSDALVLLFTAKGVDRNGIVEKFCEIYETIKFKNVPIEVIYIPMDDTKGEMLESYQKQANWFTLNFDDVLVPTLMYLYGISSIPYMLVIKPDGTIISTNGIMDLVEYGKNAVITWLNTPGSMVKDRNLVSEAFVYGEKWEYREVKKELSTPSYQRRFSVATHLQISSNKATDEEK